MSDSPSEITLILREMADGDSDAFGRLLPIVYDDLRRLAAAQLARERPGHTLQPTALIHEAYLRLGQVTNIQWSGRNHFFGAAAQAIRRILVDHARSRKALKRGGAEARRVELEAARVLVRERTIDVLALDEALHDLARLSPDQARIVELRVFAGMTNPEIAAVLDMRLRTLEGEWSMAKQWLRTRLADTED